MSSRKRFAVFAMVMVLAAAQCTAGPGGGADANAAGGDLASMSLEDLMRMEVRSVSRKEPKMWGAKAAKGVISIRTKKAKDTQGGVVSLEGGAPDHTGGALLYGGYRGSRLGYRLREDHTEQGNTPFMSWNYHNNLFSAFLQDYITLVPGVRLSWSPRPVQSVQDRSLQLYLPLSVPGPMPAREIMSRVATGNSAFANRCSGLQSTGQLHPYIGMSLSPTAARSWLCGNFDYGHTIGVPMDAGPGLQAPRNTFDLRFTWDMTRRLSFDTSWYYTSHMTPPDVPKHGEDGRADRLPAGRNR